MKSKAEMRPLIEWRDVAWTGEEGTLVQWSRVDAFFTVHILHYYIQINDTRLFATM